MIWQKEINLPPLPRGYHLITQQIQTEIDFWPHTGILHIFIKHTSAAITINENADPSVRHDFESVMNHIVPENMPFLTHTLEGADDMPAHIKAALIGNQLTIPITQKCINLGTWQGIYLCEFRNQAGPRTLVLSITS